MQAASTCGSAWRARILTSRSNLMGGANHTAIHPVKGKRVKDSKRIQKTTRERPGSRFGLAFGGLRTALASPPLVTLGLRAEGPGPPARRSPWMLGSVPEHDRGAVARAVRPL